MNQPSFKKVAQLNQKTAEVAQQNDEMLKLAMQDVQLKKQHLDMERMAFEQEKYADIRHQVNQMCDFAIRTLPFWNRSPKAICNRATELLFAIKRETAKHIAMEVLSQKIQEENKPIEEVKAETEAKLDEIIESDRV